MDSPKYPKTFHVPSSPCVAKDDKRMKDVESLLCVDVVATEKADGSNVCMEHPACFARSHASGASHESFDAFKAFHAGVRHLIPNDFQMFGEWLYAKHSIHYLALPAYFLLFGVRDLGGSARWLAWEEVEMWAEELGVPTVPVLDRGSFNRPWKLNGLIDTHTRAPSRLGAPQKEGVVIRWASGFSDANFSSAVGKWVRKDHVQTDKHWKNQPLVRNRLAS